MRAPCEFKYSPHGYDIKIVREGDEMTAYEQSLAIDMGLVGAPPAETTEKGEGAALGVESTPTLRDKVARLFGAKARPPHANKATGPDFNK